MSDFTGNAVCTCGKEMTKGVTSFGGNLSYAARNCECGMTAIFLRITKDESLSFKLVKHNQFEEDKKLENKLLSLFELSNIKILDYWNIRNEYSKEKADWLLIKTKAGMIKIGWRYRVINIDWEDTGIRKIVTNDGVTKGESGVHADSYADAIKYLVELMRVG